MVSILLKLVVSESYPNMAKGGGGTEKAEDISNFPMNNNECTSSSSGSNGMKSTNA